MLLKVKKALTCGKRIVIEINSSFIMHLTTLKLLDGIWVLSTLSNESTDILGRKKENIACHKPSETDTKQSSRTPPALILVISSSDHWSLIGFCK